MVAFVEHIAGWHGAAVDAPRAGAVGETMGSLDHDEGVVGHHQLGGAGTADGVFDVAAFIVRAGAVDAFATPVGQAQHGSGTEQLAEPAWQVAARNIAVGGGERPTGQQRQGDDPGRYARAGQAVHPVLQVQQAEVVLPPLTHHDPAAALGRVGIEPGEFGFHLSLQVAGVGADPHRRPVELRP
jgi:hypothetical protein